MKAKRLWLEAGLPALFLAAFLTLTFYLWKSSRDNVNEQIRLRFEAEVKEIAFSVQKRLDLYTQALYGTRAFLSTAGPVSRSQWEQYTSSESLSSRYPAIGALQYIEMVRAEGKEEFIRSMRSLGVEAPAYSYFTVRPEGERPEYFVVKYLQPLPGRESWLGLDHGADAALREALKTARETSQPCATAPLKQFDASADSRVMVFLPVSPDGGFVAADFSPRQVLQGAFRPGLTDGILVEVYDGASRSEEALIYESRRSIARAEEGSSEVFSGTQIPMEIGGRVWMFYFSTQKGYAEDMPGRTMPLFVLGVGVVFSVLVSLVVYALAGSSARALALAERMTKDLSREVQERRAADAKLQVLVKDLELRNHEASLLGELGELLQSCSSVGEAHELIARFASQLFPGTQGALYLFNASHELVEAAASWGPAMPGENVFVPDDCWALKRGKTHGFYKEEAEPVCHHAAGLKVSEYLCVPMLAHGEGLGLLHVRVSAKSPGDAFHQDMAISVAEQAALALANLRLREALHNQSIRDKLTGLFNRRYLEESFSRELVRVSRQKQPLCVAMLDIDHFKKFNDTYGHEVGDNLLSAVGAFLAARVRAYDIACRYGGEEFVLILPGVGGEDGLRAAEKIREEARTIKVHVAGKEENVTFSIGVSEFPKHGATAEELLRAADRALYEAKHAGRDRVCFAQGPSVP